MVRINKSGEVFVKLLYWGCAGSGKTRITGTFPNALFLDTNKGTKTLENNDNVQVISLEHTTQDERGNEVNPNVYKTIIQILESNGIGDSLAVC